MAKKARKLKKPIKKSPARFSIKEKKPQSKLKSEVEPLKKTKIRVIGVGGGAGNIVSEIASRVTHSSFAAANTDSQALRTLNRNVLRFQFGQNLTQGLGTGMNQGLAEQAASQEKERIKKLFQDQDFCVIVSSLGGGTGSGAAPVFAKVAKNMGLLTLGIFTMPFKFEGEKKMEIAREALLKLKPDLNAIVVLPNERIFQVIDKDTPLKEALSRINKNLAEGLEGLIEIIYLPGLINIDFADLKTILEGRGRLAFLNTAQVPESSGGTEAAKKALASPLYSYTARGAKGILFNISGEKELSLSDVSQISKMISEMVNPEAKIIFGISQSKKYQDKIKVSLLATGCPGKGAFAPLAEENQTKKPKAGGRRRKPKPKKESLFGKIKFHLEKKSGRDEERKKEKNKEKPKVRRKQPKPRTLPKLKEKKPAGAETAKEMEKTEEKPSLPIPAEIKIRKNALQIKKETEEAERELLEKEKFWETPAFLRKQQGQ